MSQLKLILALALLFAVIFGVAVISSSTPPADKKPLPGPGQTEANIPPLVSDLLAYKYDPKAIDADYQNRHFAGFFEIGTGGTDNGRRNWVPFVMRNFRTQPVKLSPLPPSCTKCTNARAAVLPEGAVPAFAQFATVGNLLTIGGVPNPVAALAWAEAYAKLDWFAFDFREPKTMFTIPAAADKLHPQWVILELDFRVTAPGAPAPVKAYFDLYDAKNNKIEEAPKTFEVTYAAREAFEIWPPTLAAGEFPEGVAPRAFEIFAYSMTRDQFPPPTSLAVNNTGTFVLGTPEPLSNEDCERLAGRVGVDLKGIVRVRSGYRIPVTIHRQAPGGAPPEVGEFEKEIHVANSTICQVTYKSTVKGAITGPIRIDGAKKFDLGDYQSAYRVKKDFTLLSDRTDLDLELVPERCEPKFVQLELSKATTEAGRRSWTLSATIPEQQGRSSPYTGVVVLRTTGANPTTFRFPLTGHGR